MKATIPANKSKENKKRVENNSARKKELKVQLAGLRNLAEQMIVCQKVILDAIIDIQEELMSISQEDSDYQI